MVKKESIRHKIARIQDDGGQHEQKENIGSQRGRRFTFGRPKQQKTNDDTHNNQQAGFGKDVMQFRCHVKSLKILFQLNLILRT